jgi:FkbM family methyltransferase
VWHPEDLKNEDSITWDYTNSDRHFWPPDGMVPDDAKLIVDVGCNAGLSTGLFADHWKQAKVIGIELDGGTAQRARDNLVSFGDRVEIIHQAVGFPERIHKAIFPRANAVNYLDGYYPENSDILEQKDVEIKSLDFVLKNAGVGKQIIDFMKIDIEGSEWELIFDGGKWPRRTMAMVVEIHTNRDRADFENQMRNLGFEISYNAKGQTVGSK